MLLQSETKIEPDLRLLYGSLLTLKSDKDSKYTFDINYDSFTIHKTKFF